MKIQIASDLHFELWERHLPDPLHQFTPDESRDVLILAGDIVDGKRFYGMPFIHRELEMSPVILVPGNHEYYHSRRQEVDAFWRGFAKDYEDFYYLNDDTAEIAGLRVYGAQWCSDFWGEPPIVFHERIEDFHLTPGWDTFAHLEEHQRITARLAGLAGKVDVVITYFPPTLEAIDLTLYEGDPNNGYFINDAEPLVRDVGAKLWVAGHIHSPFDYRVGPTRVVGNPRGYPFEPARPGFAAIKTIEVNEP